MAPEHSENQGHPEPAGAGTPADIDGSGVVDALDILALIAGWGPC